MVLYNLWCSLSVRRNCTKRVNGRKRSFSFFNVNAGRLANVVVAAKVKQIVFYQNAMPTQIRVPAVRSLSVLPMRLRLRSRRQWGAAVFSNDAEINVLQISEPPRFFNLDNSPSLISRTQRHSQFWANENHCCQRRQQRPFDSRKSPISTAILFFPKRVYAKNPAALVAVVHHIVVHQRGRAIIRWGGCAVRAVVYGPRVCADKSTNMGIAVLPLRLQCSW